MKLDLNSLYFNSIITNQDGGQASWSTSLGQERAKGYPVQLNKEGICDLLAAMLYNCCSDIYKLDISKMSSKRELLYYSVFKHVYVNGVKLPKAKFIMAFVREHTKTSEGKLHLCYAPYLSYRDQENGVDVRIKNSETLSMIASCVGCSDNGCWFVRKIKFISQSSIDFRVVVVNKQSKAVYATHKDRSDAWDRLAALDLLEEECIAVSKNSESFYRYLTEYLPDRIGAKTALNYCRCLSTIYVTEYVKKIFESDSYEDVFSLVCPEQVSAVIDRISADCENAGVYAGIPSIALSLYRDFLRFYLHGNKNT